MFKNQNILGIVMCGGNSTRMGQDKGLLLKGDIPWVAIAVEKFLSIPLMAMVSINSTQFENYISVIDSNKLIVDQVEIPGPLGGLLSVHCRYPTYDLLILACDMVDVTTNSIKHLYTYCTEEGSEFDFIVYKNDQDLPEPLLGWYSCEGLSKIYKYYLGGMLEKFSMKHILDISNTQYLTFPNSYEELKNYNTMS